MYKLVKTCKKFELNRQGVCSPCAFYHTVCEGFYSSIRQNSKGKYNCQGNDGFYYHYVKGVDDLNVNIKIL